jgi:hypothetical protein
VHQSLIDENWAKIHTAFTEMEAHLITGILTGEGIECRVRSRRVPQLPVSHGLLGTTEIYVPKAEAPVAQRILMVYRNSRDEDESDTSRAAWKSSPLRPEPNADLP